MVITGDRHIHRDSLLKMHLQKLKITDFKNFSEAGLQFCNKINCFVGDNGVGKTNLLDAIYYLSFCKSYFNQQDHLNIRHETDVFVIHGDYQRNDGPLEQVSCIQRRNHKKQFRLNKKDYERLADHIGLIPLVMVSPSDSDLINLGSEERRKYFDGVISQFDQIYLDELIQYNRVLRHRNTLLKEMSETGVFDPARTEIWDRQLFKHGNIIFEKRKAFLERFHPVFIKYFKIVSEDREEVSIEYKSQLQENDFESLLIENRARELALRYTAVGTHKDDFNFSISGFPAKRYGSQGQQKSYLISLKLAQFEYTRNIKGQNPILLLDDIFDKLDEHRVEQIIKLVAADDFGQVFITDTQAERINKIFRDSQIDHRIFVIGKESIMEK